MIGEKKKQKPSSHTFVYLSTCLLVVSAFALGWWFWHGMYAGPPRLKSILLVINDEPHDILSGETIALHPMDRVKILKISTTIPFNYDVRLATKGFDVSALRYEEKKLADMFTDEEIFDHHRFRIHVMYRNKELGRMDWDVQPYVEDWLDKADRIIDRDKRLAILERGLCLLPDDRELQKRLLSDYRFLKQWKKAAAMLEEIWDKNHEYHTLVELLEVYTKKSDKAGIISVLKRLVKLDPGDVKARYQLAEALEESGKLKHAIKEYKGLLSLINEKDKLEIYKTLGYLYNRTGQSKAAISSYLKATELDKKDANLYYNLSCLCEKIRQKEKADVYLSRAIELSPRDVKSRLKLAQRLMEKGELVRAKKYLLQVLNIKQDSIEALRLMARLLEKRGGKKDLIKTYKKILDLDPRNETVMYNLGALEYEAGNLKVSLPYFKKYLEAYPKEAGVHEILFDIYKRQKKAGPAFKEAMTLVELKPKEISTYHFIFDHLNASGDYDNIIRVMKKGVKANTRDTDLKEYLVLAYLKTGQEDLAIKQINEILKLRPKDINLLLHLAKLQEKQGKFTQALEAYKKIIGISSGHEEAEEAYLRLRLRGVERDE